MLLVIPVDLSAEAGLLSIKVFSVSAMIALRSIVTGFLPRNLPALGLVGEVAASILAWPYWQGMHVVTAIICDTFQAVSPAKRNADSQSRLQEERRSRWMKSWKGLNVSFHHSFHHSFIHFPDPRPDFGGTGSTRADLWSFPSPPFSCRSISHVFPFEL